MIYLYQFTPLWGLLNPSPFCMKLEVYLKLANIPYQVKHINNPGRAPKSKLPFIKDGDQVIADSSLVIDYLKTKYGNTLDQHLTPRQIGQNIALQRMIEEHLYWIMVYSRWMDPAEWPKVKSAFFSHLPLLLRMTIPGLVRRGVKKALYQQGIGRHSQEEIYALGKQDITALAAMLNSQLFFCGEKPTTIDATAYGFLANILFSPVESPLKLHAQTISQLTAYCERMKKRLETSLKSE